LDEMSQKIHRLNEIHNDELLTTVLLGKYRGGTRQWPLRETLPLCSSRRQLFQRREPPQRTTWEIRPRRGFPKTALSPLSWGQCPHTL
jgi:hypothetical protein